MTKTIILAGAVALSSMLACTKQPTGVFADTVFTGGRIYTVDPGQPWAEAVAIKDGRFIKVGSNEDVQEFVGEETQVIGLHDRMAIPGIIDLNTHPFPEALFTGINLGFSDPTNPKKMLAELKAFAEAHPEKKWIRGGWWASGVFPNDSPSRRLLDRVVRDRPVVLIDQTGRSYWLNSKALALAGITAETATDSLNVVDKDRATGRPTGVIRENALRMVERVADQPSSIEYRKAFEHGFRVFNSEGVTAVQTAEGNAGWLDVVQTMERDGDLTMRLFIGWDWHLHPVTPYTDLQMDQQIEDRARYASDMIDPNSVSIFLDGSFERYAARLLTPYSDGSDERGEHKIRPGELRDVLARFDAEGVGTLIHSTGDASTRSALNAIEAARKTNGDTGVRHRIADLALVHPKDIPRFGTIAGVAAVISPPPAEPTAVHESHLPLQGPRRDGRQNPARSLIEAGARLAYGSDWPTLVPADPWMSMQGFVTRRNPALPDSIGELGENETLTVEQVLRVFTINGAYAVGADRRIGSIEEGKLADMVIIDQNLFDIDPARIRDTQVLLTILGGKVIYARERDS